MKNAFGRLISRLDTIKAKIHKIKNRAIEINQTGKQRENRVNKTSKSLGQYQTIQHMHKWNTRKPKKSSAEEIFEKK